MVDKAVDKPVRRSRSGAVLLATRQIQPALRKSVMPPDQRDRNISRSSGNQMSHRPIRAALSRRGQSAVTSGTMMHTPASAPCPRPVWRADHARGVRSASRRPLSIDGRAAISPSVRRSVAGCGSALCQDAVGPTPRMDQRQRRARRSAGRSDDAHPAPGQLRRTTDRRDMPAASVRAPPGSLVRSAIALSTSASQPPQAPMPVRSPVATLP